MRRISPERIQHNLFDRHAVERLRDRELLLEVAGVAGGDLERGSSPRAPPPTGRTGSR
jgi:hypothetical protein